ncbi:formin-like protein 16 [Oryza brachyantha]|uniref:formin-like protein 16 n=1 Tax=Oryza brachyantha TaxID=4533 RepID=UPI001AD96491|nr:formin-like protein 16 [Oryza brachyantha]
MSIRSKRKVAPPPQAIASSTDPLVVPTPQVAPYPYGLWFPPPPTPWLPSPQSHAMSGSPAFPPPTAGKIDVHSDLEEWGVESRPPGGFVNFINTPSNNVHHVAEGSLSRPINVDNGDVSRTEKRLSWMKDEDLRLEHVLLWNSWCCTSYSKMMIFQAMVV